MASWTGWAWRGGRWCRVCTGESVGDVARQMNALARDVPTHRQVITGGAAPTFAVKGEGEVMPDYLKGRRGS